MNSRSQKYFANNKSVKKQLNDNTKADKKIGEQKPLDQKSVATQDDTGGGNDSGKRSDDN